MKKLCWFALLLAGCGRPVRHVVDGPRPPAPIVDPAPPAPPESKRDPGPARLPPREEPRVEALDAGVRLPSEGPRIAEVNGALEDIYFAYDRAELSADARAALRHDATLLGAILAEFPGLKVIIEGHCDERGSAEYNLGLGDRRARRAEAGLHEFGVPAGAVDVISYGKEAPQCTEPTEACYQRNRRAHMAVKR